MAIPVTGVIFIAILSYTAAEVINYKPCPNVAADSCTISEVRIDPCKENPNACLFKRKKDANISFDFVPNFNATNLKTMVYWARGATDLEYLDYDDDGCKLTKCPTVSGENQQFNYSLHVGKMLPSGAYPLKWKVWNEQNVDQVCCFMVNIRIR